MSRFNFADYLRFKETSKLSREIEKQKKEESERLIKTNERNDLLRKAYGCLLYTSPSPRDVEESRMPSSA